MMNFNKNSKYDNHFEFANDLFQFAKMCLKQNDRISFRMGIGRLYYAFYHKILHENKEILESIKESKNMHAYIFDHNNLPLSYYHQLKTLKRMRQWADYQTDANYLEKTKIDHMLAMYERIFQISIKIKK